MQQTVQQMLMQVHACYIIIVLQVGGEAGGARLTHPLLHQFGHLPSHNI